MIWRAGLFIVVAAVTAGGILHWVWDGDPGRAMALVDGASP